MNNKILILDGGGQLGSFQWGVMTELSRLGINYEYFDYYIVVSAGAFNAAYFLTEQYDEGKDIWLKFLPNGFWKFGKNDMEYLKKILTQVRPLKHNIIRSKKQKIIIALTNSETLQPEYTCLNDQSDIINCLLACCSMPFYSGTMELDRNTYFDGGLISQPPISYVINNFNNDNEVWAILNRPTDYIMSEILWKAYSYLPIFSKNERCLIKQHALRYNKNVETLINYPNIKIIAPERALALKTRDNNISKSRQAFAAGEITAQKFVSQV